VRRWLVSVFVLIGCASGGSDDDDAMTPAPSQTDAVTIAAIFERHHLEEVVRGVGATPNEGGRATVIGFRGRSIDGAVHDTKVAEVFDDAFAVLLADGRVVVLPGATHPWFRSSSLARDADGDGRPDVGMIRAGRYRAIKNGKHFGAPKYAVTTRAGGVFLPGFRNTDHDGAYSVEERDRSTRRGDAVDDVRFHAAGPGSLAPIGCQVLSPADMNRLAALVGEAFDYILIEEP
jgi:hypothetical protein